MGNLFNQTDVKILGKKAIKVYGARYHNGTIYDSIKVIDYPLIWEGLLDYPPFEERQRIYIDDIEQEVEIVKIVRSTSNKYVYYVDYLTEKVIENEETEKSYQEALIESEEIKKERRKEEEEREQQKLEKEREKLEQQKSKFRKILDIIKS